MHFNFACWWQWFPMCCASIFCHCVLLTSSTASDICCVMHGMYTVPYSVTSPCLAWVSDTVIPCAVLAFFKACNIVYWTGQPQLQFHYIDLLLTPYYVALLFTTPVCFVGFRQEWEELLVSHKEPLLAYTLDSPSCPSVPVRTTRHQW